MINKICDKQNLWKRHYAWKPKYVRPNDNKKLWVRPSDKQNLLDPIKINQIY
jgi:hypothetical protein